ncbi:MAG: Sporulation related domain [Algoriphagus marincola HL-49]|uniref:Sporulation related domain n=1 Tax=Algoriphagus marincola HL-49 TaxID=1305737 RepID=A0A0P7YUT9_9BACT|nr:MAG: Sporulation related domain [Algoriphagus marincola HL-49]
MKKREKETWTDPKDFGLPFVEIKKLKELEENIKSNSESTIEGSEEKAVSASELRSKVLSQIPPKPIQEKEPLDEFPDSIESENVGEGEEPKSEEKKTIPAKSPELPAKKSSSWVMVAAFIGLLLISTVVWQLMKEENSSPTPSKETSSEPVAESTLPSASDPEIIPIDTQNNESEGIDNQDSINLSSNNPNPPAPTAESGTTIDRKELGSLTRIESRGERATYFIIVGSLRTERLAIDKSAEYQSRVPELYLITPYEDSPNYRLALGKYNSFTQANNALAEIKDDYTEALWILKY